MPRAPLASCTSLKPVELTRDYSHKKAQKDTKGKSNEDTTGPTAGLTLARTKLTLSRSRLRGSESRTGRRTRGFCIERNDCECDGGKSGALQEALAGGSGRAGGGCRLQRGNA